MELDKLKQELTADIDLNTQAIQAIDTVDCQKKPNDRYNQRLTDRTGRQQSTLSCNERRVRELYRLELNKALEEVKNSISNL